MKAVRILFSFAALLSLFVLTAWCVEDAPGWFKAGSQPDSYDMGTDNTVAHTGSSSGYIRSIKPVPQGFGTFMQMFDASQYRGKRLRYAAFVKCVNIERWAGLWMRIDKGKDSIAFDNMQQRPIRGTSDWTEYSIVLDVSRDAEKIAFGILMDGAGAAWIDDVQFTIVGEDVPVTDMLKSQQNTPGPKNLNFDEK
jgi:hypothetical protein